MTNERRKEIATTIGLLNDAEQILRSAAQEERIAADQEMDILAWAIERNYIEDTPGSVQSAKALCASAEAINTAALAAVYAIAAVADYTHAARALSGARQTN